MSKPQIENGFIQIACGSQDNDILLALAKAELTGTELAVCLIVIRKTWGWKKKEDQISISQFVEATGKVKQSIINATNSLVKKNILVRSSVIGVKTTYSFNKDFSTWLVQNNGLVQKTLLVQNNLRTSTKNCTGLVQKIVHTKENKKKLYKRKIYITIYDLNDEHFQKIAELYSVPISFVRSKYEDMVNWHESTGKKKKDWIATLRGFVKRDAVKIRKESHERSKIDFIDA